MKVLLKYVFDKIKTTKIKMFTFVNIVILTLMSFTSCKKDSSGSEFAGISTLSFSFNGKPYTLTYTSEGLQPWGISTDYLYINRPDIFGGIIRMVSSHCGYREPYEGAVLANGNCDLITTAIDSTLVYFFESGSLQFTYTNCKNKQGYDIVTGINYNYQICDGNGTFNLRLKNYEGKEINITNGIATLYNIKR